MSRFRPKPTREHYRTALVMRIQFAPERITDRDVELGAKDTGWTEEHIRERIAERLGRAA